MFASVDNDTINSSGGYLTCNFPIFGKYNEITKKIQILVGSFLVLSLYFQKYVNLQVEYPSKMLIVLLSTEIKV